MYQCVLQAVRQALGDQKIMQVDNEQLEKLASSSFTHHSLHSPTPDALIGAGSRLPFTYEPQV